MPTYDYECSSCNSVIELFQKITDNHEKRCPECGKESLTRLISAGGGVIFKGAGFYQNDYKNK